MSYITGISGNVISAASAGYAPTNSATVSAIASAYAESAASGKLDSSASSSFYTTANESSFIDTAYLDSALTDFGTLVSNNFYSTGNPSSFVTSGDLDSALNDFATIVNANFYPTSNPSSFVGSSYVDSSVSGKADSSALSSYALSSDVSGVIDTVSSNSASWGGGGATGDYVEKSAMEVAIGSGNDVSATAFAWGENNSAYSASVAFGQSNSASKTSLSVGYENSATSRAFAFGSNSKASTRSMAFGDRATAGEGSLAFGSYCKASMDSYAFGSNPSATDYSFAFGKSSVAKNSSVAEGYRVSADFTAVAFGTYNLHGNGHTGSGDSAAFVIGDGTANAARHDLMLVTKDGEITMYSSTADTVGTGIMSSIRAISAAATGGGVDSATVSSIASSYAESAASSKMDSSASSSFYTTANESGYIGSAYVESSISAYQPLSGMSAYESSFSAGDGLEFVQSGDDRVLQVEAPVDIVAGPGIVVDNPDGNTLRVSQSYPTDETVLYNNSAAVESCTLSETIFNFERIKVYSLNGINSLVAMEFECSGSGYLNCMIAGGNNQPVYRMIQITVDSTGTSLAATRSVGIFFNTFSGTPTYRFSSSADLQCINKVVGIHRIAGGN